MVIGLDLDGGEVGPSAGFELVRLNDWFNPRWGGGFNASFTYTVQESDLVDGEVHAWEILPNYTGEGEITNAWVAGYPGSTFRGENEEGEYVISTKDRGYRPELEAGDTIDFTVQVRGAGFEEDNFAFDFNDLDRVPNGNDPQMAEIVVGRTLDWRSGFGQTVSVLNSGDQPIDDWAVELDVPDGVDVDFVSVWGAKVTEDAEGDLIFIAETWNASIREDGRAHFGFIGTYDGAENLRFEDEDFTFHPGGSAMQDHLLVA